jgi:hypothetical protein
MTQEICYQLSFSKFKSSSNQKGQQKQKQLNVHPFTMFQPTYKKGLTRCLKWAQEKPYILHIFLLRTVSQV